MTTPAQDQDGLLSELLVQCEGLERGLLSAKSVIADAINAQRPGGADNPDTTSLGWLKFFAWLHRTHATGVQSVSAATGRDDAKALERTLAAALTDQPVAVECSDGVTRYAYPKSYDTLRFLDELDVELRLTTERWAVARQLDVDEDHAVVALAPRMESLTVRLWAWVITSKGAELPFEEDRPLPTLPKWTRCLAPEDLIALLQAHLQVNARRLQIVASAFPPDPADAGAPSRLTLAGFLGSVTAENEPGAARRLLKGTPLGQIFAARVTAARASREAMERAKAKQPDR